ncbi:hypothetical protein B566_EDAN017644 [Ephemera danica]|nr:hypothetical protein B566_EDAN017644 [Ephemera danica]
MAEEVSGSSAFVYRGGGGFGSSVYRLLTKNQEFIYLRSHGHLEYDETGEKPVAQLPLHRRESSSTKVGSPGMSEPTSSPRPVVMRVNGRTTSMCSMSPTDSLLGSVSPPPPPPPQPVHDPLLAGAQGTCYVRATRRREIISTATGTITIETATVGGQVSSRPRRRQTRLNNKRHLSGDEVSATCTEDLLGGGKRSCTEPPVRWEPPVAPLSPTARSVCSNDTDFSFRDGLEETSVRNIQLKSSKQQTDIGV